VEVKACADPTHANLLCVREAMMVGSAVNCSSFQSREKQSYAWVNILSQKRSVSDGGKR